MARGIKVLKQKGNLRLVAFSKPPLYRVETVMGRLRMGTTYNTREEAENAWRETLQLRKREKDKSTTPP